MGKRTTEFQTIRSEGGLLPPDLLRRVVDPAGKVCGVAFLVLMLLHSQEHVVQESDGGEHVGTLVEHHAFGATAHGGIGHFRARGQAFLGESFENLGGPDHRDVRGFADPENVLLQFGEMVQAGFDGQVAAGHHDAERGGLHPGQQDAGQMAKRGEGFDFQHHRHAGTPHFGQRLSEQQHVFRAIDEGQAGDVRVLDREAEVLQILGAQRGHGQFGIGQVDAFFGAKLRALGRGANHAFDLAVVEANPVPGLGVAEHRIEGAGNTRRLGPPARLRLTADRTPLRADRDDLCYVTVEVTDAAGNLVPNAALPVRFTVSGAGELAAVGSGNPREPASFREPVRTTFQGRCLAILRPTGGSGPIRLRAEADGPKSTMVSIGIK